MALFDFVTDEILRTAYQFGGSLLLLLMVIVISYWRKVGMEKTFIWATIRGFGQLLALASILFFVFQLKGLLPLFGILLVMIIFGAQTAADRVDNIDNVFLIELVALGIGVNMVMILMSVINVLPTDNAAFWIPIGGMVTGNSMNISYLTLDRIQSDIRNRKDEIDAALSLGASPEVVMQKLKIIPNALKVGLTPNTNNLKTLGLVFIPGLMTGLLIGGTHPIAAAFLQVMIFFLILGGGAIAALIATVLVTKNIFNMDDQALPPDFPTS